MSLFDWKKTLHIVRGLPGEGKSTLALSLVGDDRRKVVENDDFWYVPTTLPNDLYNESGPYLHYKVKGYEYQYQREITHLAANWCGAEAFRRLRIFDVIAVANVFSKREYILGYLSEAKKLGVRVYIHRPQTAWVNDVDVCNAKNIHFVPQLMIQKFRDEWEDMTQDEVDILINLPSELRVARQVYNR